MSHDRAVRFANYLKETGAAKSTGKTYRTAVHCLEALLTRHGTSIEAAPRHTLQVLFSQLAREGTSPASLRTYKCGIGRYLEWLKDYEDVQVPDFIRPRLPAVHRKVRGVLRAEHLPKFEALVTSKVKDPGERYALLMMPYSGLRISELVKLRVEDVRIVRTKGGPSMRFHVVERRQEGETVKTDDRVVPLLRRGMVIMANYLARVRPAIVNEWQKDSPYLWMRSANERTPTIHAKLVYKGIYAIRDELGFPGMSSHTMRHTYASILQDNDVDPFMIAMAMGHKSLSTTAIYTHPAVDKLADRIHSIEI